jgi:hypothetical protein
VATYPSNLILAGGGQAAPSAVPASIRPVTGTVVVPNGVTIGAGDTFPLFYMSGASPAHIVDFMLDSGALDSGATLTVSLMDSTTPTANTIIAASTVFRAGGILTSVNAAHATIGSAVSYTSPQNLILLRAVAGAGAGVGATPITIYFYFAVSKD